ncbi:4800_t:CDS:2 [Paraglomus brasilianum]|uniref:peptidyl-tRNA hydrolase n=1 Tax=Paraglomus brasilianum TaxID=144538 RepID=A0A9N9G622_9GLOM|nr:4800_t:CDS:2 [Paraglomus brasilianum]
MDVRRILLVGLGNHTHPNTRHSVGFLAVDYIAEQLGLKWTRDKNYIANVASTTLSIDLPRTKQKKQKEKKAVRIKDLQESNKKVDNNDIENIALDDNDTKENHENKNENKSGSENGLIGVKTKKRDIEQPRVEPIRLEMTLMKPGLLMNLSGKSVGKAVRNLHISPSNIIVIHDDMQRELGKISPKFGGSANGHNGIKSIIECLRTDQFHRLRIGIGRPPSHIDDRSHAVVSSYVLRAFTRAEKDMLLNEVFPKSKDEVIRLCTTGTK